ncbi:TetR family transcriptional regulator [Allomuricauda sp. NBRC 101325]|uniref:TetR family transcriptional regulator n=1 Tax=Allomuricauda sp. NBRC 101325 TaxID=1113758 RepID=UPI0024A5EF44|nr:TetR family transcriptional regulator [Muricauda sp. NBRC 101325]GLU44585.1 HTH-type transcriptional repressor KstR2 [Muricauda sp. NBRC 101325]
MKKKTKREHFLEESLKLIHEKGFKATTLRDIAHKLDCEVANIYNYIDSKQSLLELHLFEVQQVFMDRMEQILDSTLSPKEQLQQLIASYIQISNARPFEQALIVNEWRYLSEPKLKEFQSKRKLYEQQLQTILKDGIELGEFRNMDIDIATQSILGSLRWVYTKFIDPDLKPNPIEIEKQLTNFIFGAIVYHD